MSAFSWAFCPACAEPFGPETIPLLCSCGHSTCQPCLDVLGQLHSNCPVCDRTLESSPTPNYAILDLVCQNVVDLETAVEIPTRVAEPLALASSSDLSKQLRRVAYELQQTADQILISRIALETGATEAALRWNSIVDDLIAEMEKRRIAVLSDMRVELNLRQKLLQAQHDELSVSSSQAFAAALALETGTSEYNSAGLTALNLQHQIGQRPRAPVSFELLDNGVLQAIKGNIAAAGVIRDFDVDPTQCVAEIVPYGLRFQCRGKTQPCDWMTAADIQISIRKTDDSAVDPACSQTSISKPGTLDVSVNFEDLGPVAVWLDIQVAGVALQPKQVFGRFQTSGHTLWQETLIRRLNSIMVPVEGADNSVLMINPYLVCLDGSTGERRWTVGGDSGFCTPPSYNSIDQVFVLQKDGYLKALDARTGDFKWEKSIFFASNEIGRLCSRLDVVVITTRSKIIVLEGRTGELMWMAACVFPRIAPVIGSDGTVYVACSSKEIEARDGHTGAIKWSFKIEENCWSTDFCVDEAGQLYAGACAVYVCSLIPRNSQCFLGAGNQIFALSSSGQIIWSYVLEWPSFELLLSPLCGNLYVTGPYGIVCLTLAGNVVWKRHDGLEFPKLEVADKCSNVILGFSDDDSSLVALDGFTGKTLWSLRHEEDHLKHCEITKNGTILLMSVLSLSAITCAK